jgi:ABC-type lipoprotein release transport system permease subunit
MPIALYGIDAKKELEISPLNQNIIRGKYIENNDPMEILIGEKLAQFLSVDVGDKIVLTLAQAGTGVLTQEMFRITGIFKMKNKDMDTSLAFINLNHAQSMMNVSDNFHEIVFKFKNKKDTNNAPKAFLDNYSKYNNQALSWRKLVPAIDAGIELTKYSLSIGSFILFVVIALTTMNTLFMSLYERMYEFGILKAIGTRSVNLFLLIKIYPEIGS